MPSVFIDGHVGSTGLRIRELLADRNDVAVTTLDDDLRKDAAARRDAIGAADVAILCLPDAAAKEAAAWSDELTTRIIDASSAHRVAPQWVYGLPELAGQREKIRTAKLVSNPGCYPTSSILMLRPLIHAGDIAPDAPIALHALSGYSGGGRTLIERWQASDGGLVHLPFEAPYALDRNHKHIPELQQYAGLASAPQFVPAVGPFLNGMRVQIPLHASTIKSSPEDVWKTISSAYADEACVSVAPFDLIDSSPARDERTFDPQRCNDTNRVELHVLPNPAGHVLLVGILDNLGKGASGAAVQNLNLMLGLDELTGLAI